MWDDVALHRSFTLSTVNIKELCRGGESNACMSFITSLKQKWYFLMEMEFFTFGQSWLEKF